MIAHRPKGGLAVERLDDAETFLAQVQLDEVRDVLVVLDDDDGPRLGCSAHQTDIVAPRM
jgi:hypothetical protein